LPPVQRRAAVTEPHEHDGACGHVPPVQRRALAHSVLETPGEEMDAGLRSEMEGLFGGADFSGVRHHKGPLAQASAAELGAKAYTSGPHIVEGAPMSKEDWAHELTHYQDQLLGSVPGTDNGMGLSVSSEGDPGERHAVDNARRVMTGQVRDSAPSPGEGAPAAAAAAAPVQRTLLDEDDEGEMRELSRQEVTTAAWYTELHDDHKERLERYIDGDEEYATVENALLDTRNSVVAAMDVPFSMHDRRFLKGAWEKHGNVTAFDPEMKENAMEASLDSMGIPANPRRIHRASVTDFGTHVPHTDVYVLHPGPWADRTPAPMSLASCLESIMGANSRAWIVTDDQDTGRDQSGALRTQIENINREKAAGDADYKPLTVSVEPVTTTADGRHTADLNGVPFVPHHGPSYHLTTVTRH
ncbi:eCIS core domain-containing protein, partial [Streptomyces sp. NPDC004561]